MTSPREDEQRPPEEGDHQQATPETTPESSNFTDEPLAENSLAAFPTAGAPSLPAGLSAAFPRANAPSAGDRSRTSTLSLANVNAGDRVGDFELLVELGRGGFGCVFLARQTSLDRLVALKITPDYGAEGRTLAQLEHENIVRVFSETRDVSSGLRLLCMQYVAGPTLQRTISRLQPLTPRQKSGERLLQIVDDLKLQKTAFDPSALRDRESLRQSDWVETVAWIGTRLAEALAYASRQGVLHRDIKPANVLFSQYGQPMLADFNLAFQITAGQADAAASFGGTLCYMSPESLDAFNPGHPAGPETTDQRSDLYSLGIVLYQLRHGRLPFRSNGVQNRADAATLHEMAAERRRGLSVEARRGEEHALDRTIARCLEPAPAGRFGDAMRLAQMLDGCRLLRQTERQLGIVELTRRPRPLVTFATLIAVGLIPHFLGSGIQIAYNVARIIGQLTPAQYEAFMLLVIVYNPLAYLVCFGSLIGPLVKIFRGWRAAVRRPSEEGKQGGDSTGTAAAVEDEATVIDEARRLAVDLPRRAALAGCLGWFPGAMVFPLGIARLAGPLPPPVWGHFVISFATAGLIAVTYAFLGTQLLILRWMYPQMWRDVRAFRNQAEAELRSVRPRMHTFQMLAGVIPLLGAVLLLAVSPRVVSGTEFEVFRWLVAVLILMGIAGVQLANSADRHVGRVIAAFTGSVAEQRPEERNSPVSVTGDHVDRT